MQRAVTIIAILLTLAVAGTASASTLDAGHHEAELTGRDVSLDTADHAPGLTNGPGVGAHATVDAAVGGQEASVDGPRCEGSATATVPTGRCDLGDVSYSGVSGAVDTNLLVGVHALRQTASASGGDTAAPHTFTWHPGADAGSGVVVGIATMAGAAALLAVIARAFGAFGGALVPLASRLSDDELLEDENRAAIYGLIEAEPGVSTKELAERLGLAWGTVTHHLSKLEKRRFIVSKKYGKYRRFFINGSAYDGDQKKVFAVLKVERTAEVAGVIRENPGISQKEVSAICGVSSSTILWHVKRLMGVDLVEKVRDGKMVKYYPGEAFESGLHESLDIGGGDDAAVTA